MEKTTPSALGEARFSPGVERHCWPVVPTPEVALLYTLLRQLETSQWQSPEELQVLQFRQLNALLSHACATVPWYRERFRLWATQAHTGTLTPESWNLLPRLTRATVQQQSAALVSEALPKSHGTVGEVKTSGSTGIPLRVLTTSVAQWFWYAFNLRDHLWHRRNWHGTAAMIRVIGDQALRGPEGAAAPDWGPPASWLFATGKAFMLHIAHSVDHQLAWLKQIQPDYLLTYPTSALELTRQAERTGQTLPSLRELRLFGEAVDAATREELQQHWGRVTDIYSANELGVLALQCPDFGDHYHIQAENVLLEVLDDQGRPCRPGEVGRVVMTHLHNYAMPLIRYENGDYAEVGEACPCGRGLPTLRRILGRTRNMLQLPDGSRRWPLVGFKTFRAIVPATQFQILQHNLEAVELRLVAERPLTGEEEDLLRAAVCKALDHDFQVRISCVERIERGPGGKYEEFKSLLPPGP